MLHSCERGDMMMSAIKTSCAISGVWAIPRSPNERPGAIVMNSNAQVDCVCPICGKDEVYVFRDSGAHSFGEAAFGYSRTEFGYGCILRCRRCGLGFSRERPTESQLEGLYLRTDGLVYEKELEARRRTAERHFNIVRKYVPHGSVLDVGCASGLFLKMAYDAGWSVAGVEPSKELSTKARQRLGNKGNVQAGTLQKADFRRASFDIITLWDVIEHVVEPLGLLKLCRSLLRPGGMLFINTPDLDSWPARLLGSRWPLLLPEHLNYFNHQSLQLALELSGFDVVRIGRRPTNFSLNYVFYRMKQHDLPGSSFLETVAQVTGVGALILPMYIGEQLAVARPSLRLKEGLGPKLI